MFAKEQSSILNYMILERLIALLLWILIHLLYSESLCHKYRANVQKLVLMKYDNQPKFI